MTAQPLTERWINTLAAYRLAGDRYREAVKRGDFDLVSAIRHWYFQSSQLEQPDAQRQARRAFRGLPVKGAQATVPAVKGA